MSNDKGLTDINDRAKILASFLYQFLPPFLGGGPSLPHFVRPVVLLNSN